MAVVDANYLLSRIATEENDEEEEELSDSSGYAPTLPQDRRA